MCCFFCGDCVSSSMKHFNLFVFGRAIVYSMNCCGAKGRSMTKKEYPMLCGVRIFLNLLLLDLGELVSPVSLLCPC